LEVYLPLDPRPLEIGRSSLILLHKLRLQMIQKLLDNLGSLCDAGSSLLDLR